MKKYIFLSVIIIFFTFHGVGAGLNVSNIYSDNMVIQANKPFVINGKACPFKEVIVLIQDYEKKIKADKEGNWLIRFPKLKDGLVGNIFIYSENDTITIKNVLAGELWLCSGQSNMELPAAKSDVKIDSITEQIRFFILSNEPSEKPLDQVKGRWEICNNNNIRNCSAVALSFAFHLNRVTSKPVGLIISAVGGTPIESWTKFDIVKGKAYNNHIFEDRAKWKRDFYLYENEYNVKIKEWEIAFQKANAEQKALPDKPYPQHQMRESWNPGWLYNSYIYPIRNIKLRGVIWYQGESNENYPFVYRYQLTDLIKNWRTTFGDRRLPFYVIQLPEFKTKKDWVTLRESQSFVTKYKNVSLAVTLGLGDSLNVHPERKMEVGRRVALQILKNEYKYNIVSKGPQLKKVRVKNEKIQLNFKCFGSSIRSLDGKPVCIEISGNGTYFIPGAVVVLKNSLLVWNDRIPHPTYVRYAWKNVPKQINLVNGLGLPVQPFFKIIK